ncbi:MAG: glucose 1-dehydrogenase [Chromatiales bacterium]|nr:glucose 1-dehydrogenase [Chromatiales bacterium]
MKLKDKVALVTGGGSGIGRATCIAMAAEGAHVAVADISSDAASAVASAIRDGGGAATAFTADVGDVDAINTLITSVLDKLGALDVLVNNAGVTERRAIMDIDEALWDRVNRVNAKGVFFCLQRAAKEMIPRREGIIINIASIAGRGFRATSNAAYAATKGSVISLTKIAALSLARHNINVNAICPGVTRTDLMQGILERRVETEGISIEQAEADAAKGIPLRRMNDPEDIAAMAVFLASPGGRNITGQCYNVDGGIITS